MKIIIHTSRLRGTAAHHIRYFETLRETNELLVIYSKNPIKKNNKFWKRKLIKVFRIGIPGTINGIRMRKWYKLPSENEILSIDKYCETYNINYVVTDKINSKETKQIYLNFKPDIALSLGNPYIASYIFKIPKFGMLNIHHEILPDYQNAQSIIWQIYNNSAYTGFTIHTVSKKIDEGDILFQKKVPIQFKRRLKETVISTNSLLLKMSAKALIDVIQNLEKYMEEKRRQGAGSKYTTPSFLQFVKILKNHKKLFKSSNKHG